MVLGLRKLEVPSISHFSEDEFEILLFEQIKVVGNKLLSSTPGSARQASLINSEEGKHSAEGFRGPDYSRVTLEGSLVFPGV